MSVRRRSYLPADARRAQLLDAAKRVFARRGYRAANIADICKEANVARGTIYQYFQNKRDVLIALLDDVAARVGAGITPSARRVEGAARHQAARRRHRQILPRAPARDARPRVFADEEILRLHSARRARPRRRRRRGHRQDRRHDPARDGSRHPRRAGGPHHAQGPAQAGRALPPRRRREDDPRRHRRRRGDRSCRPSSIPQSTLQLFGILHEEVRR